MLARRSHSRRFARQARVASIAPAIFDGVLGAGANSWHGVFMKRVLWLRKLCLGSCVNAKERANFNGLAIGAPVVGTEVFSSRATIAEATGGNATAAVALGALAIGGLAVGFLVVGRLIIREMLIHRVHLRQIKIDQLEVEDLRVRKLTVLEEQHSAGGPDNPPAQHI
jgi:hypothetical protein